MAFLDQWKAAKKVFEAATGQSKPSEKGSVLGVSYRKSSGIESALKALDAALAKKLVKDTTKALNDYHQTIKTYGATLEKAGKAAKDNPAYLQAVLKLTAALNGIAREAADELEALDKDPKAPVTVAEAIGPAAVRALGKSKLTTHGGLLKWLSEPTAGVVLINGKLIKDPGGKACQVKAKKAYNTLKKLYDGFNAALPKTMERGKALTLAQTFHESFENSYHAMAGDDTLQYQLGAWADGQREIFLQAEARGELKDRVAAQSGWQKRGPAWKALNQMAALWANEGTFLNDFLHEVTARQH